MTFGEKLLDVINFEVVVMWIDVHMKFDFFVTMHMVFFTLIAQLPLLLILSLTEIHHPTYRRIGLVRYEDKIQPHCFGTSSCFADGQDAELLVIRCDQAHAFILE